MNHGRLRIYYGPEADAGSSVLNAPAKDDHRVTVPLEEVFPLLADAVQSHRTWLSDFADDEITISADLYEVLLAYQHHRRPSA